MKRPPANNRGFLLMMKIIRFVFMLLFSSFAIADMWIVSDGALVCGEDAAARRQYQWGLQSGNIPNHDSACDFQNSYTGFYIEGNQLYAKYSRLHVQRPNAYVCRDDGLSSNHVLGLPATNRGPCDQVDCNKKMGQTVDMANHYLQGARLGEVALCNGGCSIHINEAQYAIGTKNGVFDGVMIKQGVGQYTGQQCPADGAATPTTPPSDVNVQPASPGDCKPGERFAPAAVNGQNVCIKGDGPPAGETDYCKQNPADSKCKPGGDEFCKANPTAYSCQPGSDPFCSANPNHASCVPGSDNFCSKNPEHKTCVRGTDEYCFMKPNDPVCDQKNDDACKTNPNSEQCKRAQTCAKNPNDPICKPTTDDFCKKSPNDEKCKGAFSGSCDSGFLCKGDAVQCAIAREMHRRNCEDSKEPDGWSDLIKKPTEKGIAWEGAMQENDIRESFDLKNPEDFAGQCSISDKTLSFGSFLGNSISSVNVPLSLICDHGREIRMIVNAITTLSCLWIIWMWVGRRF
ncbi:hypothetical protein N8I74_12240 [Chitiniphilus purpureus]|uniref:Dickkopf N-terminal cysteine-rich domain-containing protein n=1 Tax=Chitiniphilus purpureus TaxID=2981137 RepID=A0ABY6DIM1_9NEIS|nr:hypothetical protein [Chitiniphilus sp. CD1]UXY14088.1 hypothetical protein N8I74_12240 [Chitiniphilus sp. CD1]